MFTPEQSPESEPTELREKIAAVFSDADVKDRKVTNIAGDTIQLGDYSISSGKIDANFRLRFSSQPSQSKLKDIDQAIINYYQDKKDAELTRNEKTSGGRQRALELIGSEKSILIIRTNHGSSVEITTEISDKK